MKVEVISEEYHALVRLAERELRTVPAQVRVILRERLRDEGLLPKREESTTGEQ